MHLLERNIVVHVLSDDPVEMRRYADELSAYWTGEDPPRVSFGPNWVRGLPSHNTGSATTMVRRAVPTRLTTTTDFLREAILMAKCEFFQGTACSTVNDLVAGLVVGLGLPPRQADMPIGDWVTGVEPPAAAREAIRGLADLARHSTVNPENMRVSLEQLDILQKVWVEDVQQMDIVMCDLAATGTAKTSVVAKSIYDRCPRLVEAKNAFNRKVPQVLQGATPMHFFGAMIVHRLNPMLLADRVDHFWTTDNKGNLTRVTSNMQQEATEETVMVGETAPDEDVVGHRQSREMMEAGPTSSGKRARVGDALSWHAEGDNLALGAFSKAAPERPKDTMAHWYLRARPKERPRAASSAGAIGIE